MWSFLLTNTLTMSFLTEASNFELKLDVMEENRWRQLSDISIENKELSQPAATAKLNCRIVDFESDDLDEIVKSSQAQRTKYLTK